MNNTIFSFRDLRVWQSSKQFAIDVIKATEQSKKYALVDQITRSSVSIASNIAEGFERKGRSEFVQFLHIAKGSCSECITQLEICGDTGMIEHGKNDQLLKDAESINKMLMSLIAREREKSRRL